MVAEFDASLSGAGLLWYSKGEDTETAVGVCAVGLSSPTFGDNSSYQNLVEFLGAILATTGQTIMGHSVALRRDSISALTLAVTERTRGAIVIRAAMVWTLLCVAADVHVRCSHTSSRRREQNM